LWWMKRLIALRKRYRAFGRGTIEFLEPANRKVLAFTREYEDERIMVVANLSRYIQHVEMDLSRWAGMAPEELFGRSLFPPISEQKYPLTLGPHAFYCFSLAGPRPSHLVMDVAADLPVIPAPDRLDDLFSNSGRDRLEALLPAYMEKRRPGGPQAV